MEGKSYTINEISLICGISKYYVSSKLKRMNVMPVQIGTTKLGDGCRYSESDIRRIFAHRFPASCEGTEFQGIVCPVCGEQSFEAIKWTHGLCGECWCRELNKALITKKMPLEAAITETVERLKRCQVIKE